MAEVETRRGRLSLIIAAALVLVAGALWLPTWWEARQYRQAESIAGVGARLQAGSLTDARRKIETGNTAEAVEAAIGKASVAVGTEGTSRHDKWTYYYADGTMTLHLTDGAVVRIATEYGAPLIPTSRRPL
ncbi:MAG: hypothetical protein ABR576_13925 [Thermoanaerobaculia bacterium]